MHRLRHDLDHLTSTLLLVAAAATGVTGLVADVWDLNDFWPHIVVGYVMGALAVAHVVFNWRRLTAYLRFRLAGIGRRDPAPTAAGPPAGRGPARGTTDTGPSRGLLSRRGLLGLGAGAAVGFVAGRGLRPPPPIPHGSDVGVIYHEWSKPGIVDALGTVAHWGRQPEPYKGYPGAPRTALPSPDASGGPTVGEALLRRRSTRSYAPEPVSLDELSRVLQLTSGISADRWGNARRTAPSSGALYPIELYPVVHRVDGVAPGVYHYAFREHALELVRPGDFRQRVVEQGILQEFLGECAVVVFLTLILQRMRFRYQDRSYRYGLLEAGHIGQNLYLAAVASGLGACAVGAFMDDAINDMLGVDGTEEAALYMLAIGRAAAAAA